MHCPLRLGGWFLSNRLGNGTENIFRFFWILYCVADQSFHNSDLEVLQNTSFHHFTLLASNCKCNKGPLPIHHIPVVLSFKRKSKLQLAIFGSTFGVFIPFLLNISINSNRSVLMSCRISITSSSVMPKSSRFLCSAVTKRRTSNFITVPWRVCDFSIERFFKEKKRAHAHTYTRAINKSVIFQRIKPQMANG